MFLDARYYFRLLASHVGSFTGSVYEKGLSWPGRV